MLVLFAFSVMPKMVLHNLIANHKDSCHFANDHADKIQKAGHHCHPEDLVVAYPYLQACPSDLVSTLPDFPHQYAECPNDFHTSPQFFFELRGPPSLI